ncbi:MAG: hypothetical protein HZB23_03995 [Deltaproteobacteria bacterium]|nr:hypothetical protein [Deltaproteobacteria bacterium]
MKKTYDILRVVLPILAIILGGIKLAGIPIEQDTFLTIGAPLWAMRVFGLVQAACGVAIFFPAIQAAGLWSSTALLALAAILMAANGMPRAAVPLAGIATLLVFARARMAVIRKDKAP